MKTCHLNQQQRTNWLKKPVLSGRYHQKLIDNGSLTSRMKERYPDFYVRLESLRYAKVLRDETQLLSMPLYLTALIREVSLIGGQRPVVFAHSVLPRKSLRGRWLGLRRLGTKPLGASLFANPQVRRAALSFKKLSQHHELFKRATRLMSHKPQYLWARRSVFSLAGASMMVTEVFLPAILQCGGEIDTSSYG